LIQQSRKQWDAAEASAKEALAITMKASGTSNTNTAYYYTALADLYIKRNKFRDAEQSARSALSIFLSATDKNINNQHLASAEYLLAEVLVATNRSNEAEPLLRANIERWQQANAPAWRLARSRNLLGVALMKLRKTEEGKELLRQSYEALSAKDSSIPAEIVATAHERLRSFGL
jgi:tetratricopeptide (TPR) repeat protein